MTESEKNNVRKVSPKYVGAVNEVVAAKRRRGEPITKATVVIDLTREVVRFHGALPSVASRRPQP